jgi:hypothetical protein
LRLIGAPKWRDRGRAGRLTAGARP